MKKPTFKDAYEDLKQTTLNESEFAGKNISTMIAGPGILLVIGFVVYLVMTNPEYEIGILVVFGIVLFLSSLGFILRNYKLSEKNIRKKSMN